MEIEPSELWLLFRFSGWPGRTAGALEEPSRCPRACSVPALVPPPAGLASAGVEFVRSALTEDEGSASPVTTLLGGTVSRESQEGPWRSPVWEAFGCSPGLEERWKFHTVNLDYCYFLRSGAALGSGLRFQDSAIL